VVFPFMGRNVCPGREPDCLKPAGTGVCDHMYNDSNSLVGWANQGCAIFFVFFGVESTVCVPSTAGTITDGGAALGKPEGSSARRHSRNIVLKETLAYADIHTNEEYNTTAIAEQFNFGFI